MRRKDCAGRKEMSGYAGYEWYVWGTQWWHWMSLALVFVYLGFHSKTIWVRFVCILGAVFVAWLGAILLAAQTPSAGVAPLSGVIETLSVSPR